MWWEPVPGPVVSRSGGFSPGTMVSQRRTIETLRYVSESGRASERERARYTEREREWGGGDEERVSQTERQTGSDRQTDKKGETE